MPLRESKYVKLSQTTFPVAYSYIRRDHSFKQMQVTMGMCYDTVNVLNGVLGVRVFVFTGRSTGIEQAIVPNFDSQGEDPSYVFQATNQIFIPFDGPVNIVLQFYLAAGYALNAPASIEFTLVLQ